MSEAFGGTIHTISDDQGNVYRLEHLDTLEIEGKIYLAFVPADIGPEDERYGYLFMRSEQGEDGEDYLCPVEEDSEEMELVYQTFMEELFDGEGPEEEQE